MDLSGDAIRASLRGRFGHELRFLEEVDSTNTEAWRWIDEGAPEGSVVVADDMTAGRGRWGRAWLTSPGTQLLMSVVLRPTLRVDQAGLLTTAAGVACAEAIEETADLQTGIKWPNDVNLSGRKVAGILVETKARTARLEAVVVGIGVNVSWTPDEVPAEIAERATSVRAECTARGLATPSRPELLAALLQRLESACRDLSEEPEGIIERAAARSEVIGRDLSIRLHDGSTLEGRALRLLPTGALEVLVDGAPRAIDGGEVERVRAPDD